ncbi:MAG: hypothetical protein ACLT4C_00865 [Butyricicoccus sp.]
MVSPTRRTTPQVIATGNTNIGTTEVKPLPLTESNLARSDWPPILK